MVRFGQRLDKMARDIESLVDFKQNRSSKKNKRKRKREVFEQRKLPSAEVSIYRNKKARINGGDKFVVVHEEAFLSVESSTEFRASAVGLNPGNSTMFPWLSGLAQSFDKWKLESITLHFKTSCPTDTPGEVAFYWDYDINDQLPLTMLQACGMKGVVNGPGYTHYSMPFSRSSESYKSYYVASPVDGVISGQEKLYYPGQLVFCTQGFPADADTNVGRLFVKYKIRLMDPDPLGSVQSVFSNTTITEPDTLNNGTGAYQPKWTSDLKIVTNTGEILAKAGNNGLVSYLECVKPFAGVISTLARVVGTTTIPRVSVFPNYVPDEESEASAVTGNWGEQYGSADTDVSSSDVKVWMKKKGARLLLNYFIGDITALSDIQTYLTFASATPSSLGFAPAL